MTLNNSITISRVCQIRFSNFNVDVFIQQFIVLHLANIAKFYSFTISAQNVWHIYSNYKSLLSVNPSSVKIVRDAALSSQLSLQGNEYVNMIAELIEVVNGGCMLDGFTVEDTRALLNALCTDRTIDF